MRFRAFLVAASVAALALAVGMSTIAGATPRAASPEAKEACEKLKDKIKGKKGKAKDRAKAKYKKCLEDYDEANAGGGTTDPGGGTTDPGGGTTDPGGGTGTGSPQCTSLDSCPQLTRNDAAGQQAFGSQIRLERYSFGSSGQTAEYYRLFFYPNGVFRGYIVDWNSVGGESCRQGSLSTANWSFKAGYTYTVNGGGVLVVINLGSGTEIFDFRNGAGSSVYVGPNGTHFENNPQMTDNAC